MSSLIIFIPDLLPNSSRLAGRRQVRRHTGPANGHWRHGQGGLQTGL